MVSATARCLGRLSGRYILRHGLIWMRKRAERFEIAISGAEHLRPLADIPYLIVSNHVSPRVSVFGRLGGLRGFRQFNHSLDSFIYHRAVLQETGRHIATAANSDRGRWS